MDFNAKNIVTPPMALAQFRAILAAKVERLSPDDEAACERAAEVQFIIDWIDDANGVRAHHATLQDACDYVSEPNLYGGVA